MRVEGVLVCREIGDLTGNADTANKAWGKLGSVSEPEIQLPKRPVHRLIPLGAPPPRAVHHLLGLDREGPRVGRLRGAGDGAAAGEPEQRVARLAHHVWRHLQAADTVQLAVMHRGAAMPPYKP